MSKGMQPIKEKIKAYDPEIFLNCEVYLLCLCEIISQGKNSSNNV